MELPDPSRKEKEEDDQAGEVWILTAGTRGDMQPFIVLAVALQDAGYSVRLFGPGDMDHLNAGSGVPFTNVCDSWHTDKRELAPEAFDVWSEAQMTIGKGKNFMPVPEWYPFKFDVAAPIGFKFLHGLGVDVENIGDVCNMVWLWTQMPRVMGAMRRALRGKRPDLLIYNHLMVNVGVSMCKTYGVRTVFANLGLEFQLAPRGRDVFNHTTLSALDRIVIRPTTGAAPLAEMTHEEYTALYTSPGRLLGTTRLLLEAMGPADRDLAQSWLFTGFWVCDAGRQLGECAEAFGGPGACGGLRDFLGAGGPPPVYVGWGSMPVEPRVLAVVIAALMKLGLRAVVLGGSAGLSLEYLRRAPLGPSVQRQMHQYARDNVHFVDEAPHEWLLPQCACTVHHGGAGTTAAALRAGVPTLVVPIGYDQPCHGDWVCKLGVGMRLSNADKLTASELVGALRRVLADEEMKENARQVADTIRQEPGVSGAVVAVRNAIGKQTAEKRS